MPSAVIAAVLGAAALIVTLASAGRDSVGAFSQNRSISVVLDAGHGRPDAGAVSPDGVQEEALNLSITNRLKVCLEDAGYGVLMTRDTHYAIADSKDADMAKRRDMIIDSGQDATVSIHQNFHSGSASGPQVFYAPGSVEGERLAACIQSRLNAALLPEKPRTEHPGDYYIVNSGAAPAVIVECGFLSDARETGLLKKSQYQVRIARAIANGLEDYFSGDTEDNNAGS